MAKAQGTWPLGIAGSSVLHVASGIHTLVEMTWPYPAGCLSLLFYTNVAATVLLVYSDLRPTSSFASLVYTYLLSLGSHESQICLKMNTWLLG